MSSPLSNIKISSNENEKDEMQDEGNKEQENENEEQENEEQENEENEEEGNEEEEEEKDDSDSLENDSKRIELQLGDIIRINDPTDDIINNKVFMIDYIDDTKINLIREDDLRKITLKIGSNGQLNNGTIKSIELLYRNDENGYARQNNLRPGEWVNIYFEGDVPYVMTGEITNLEEDMIELKTYPDNDTIYINFDYKGIPEDLPIKRIELRKQPEQLSVKEISEGEVLEVGDKEMDEMEEEYLSDISSIAPTQPVKIHKPLPPIVIDASNIEFGKELEAIREFKTVNKENFRFNLDAQTNDLLDDLLANIPSYKRTTTVLNNIHTIITRFIQLRQLGSVFDKNNNIVSLLTKDADYKPLAEYLSKFKNTLYWIFLISQNIKKVYDSKDIEDPDISDVSLFTTKESVEDISQLFNNYRQTGFPEAQNKYIELYTSLNPQMTPFESINPEKMDGIICENYVQSDMNTVVENIDNLYSSVSKNGNITSHRFFMQNYNLGLTRLDSNLKNNSSNKNPSTQRVKLTNNDLISIKGVLTLPEPTVRFSQINLPGSTILTKSNLSLHFLNYWELFKTKTDVKDINIDSLDTDFQYDENNFVDNIKKFELQLDAKSESENQSITPSEKYNKFLNILVPRTRILFNLVKKYIKGKLSVVSLIGYMEPFLIYSNDLTFMQYKDITQFISTAISEYNKKLVENKRQISILKGGKESSRTVSILLTMLDNYPDIQNTVLEKYGNSEDYPEYTTTSEILKKITLDDFGNLYYTALAFENINLMFPTQLNAIFEKDTDKLNQTLLKDQQDDKCKTYTIAKKYRTMEELSTDNGKVIFFDKEFDTTPYSLLDNFTKEQAKLPPEDFKLFLSDTLQKPKYKYNAFDAEYVAESLTFGFKKVMDGQYAVVYDDERPSEVMHYYVRRDNNWIEDPSVDKETMMTDPESLCLIQPSCISVNKHIDSECESLEMTKDTIVSNALKEIMDQFDKHYEISKEELTTNLNKYLQKYTDLFDKLEKLHDYNFYKYNNQKYNIGLSLLEIEQMPKEESPYISLRNLILGQGDFLKKQTDIIRFARKFTRTAELSRPNIEDQGLETPYWLYCNKTNTKLLPTFLFTLASTFIQNNEMYDQVMDQIINEQGIISDDGGRWEDEHSGFEIKPIDWDVEEGYEAGFKKRSREVLEEDAGQVQANAMNVKKLLSPQSKSIVNIVQSLSYDMGINIDNQMEFIITIVSDLMNDTKILMKESTYTKHLEEMSKKGKKIPEYEFVYNSTFIYIILGTYLIAIQTSIPSIRTRKTFPGCVRSFKGFPLEGEGDYSGLNYLACVAYHKKSKTNPWNVLTKQEKIAESIKNFTIKYLLPNPEIIQKIQDKIDYLLVNKEQDIPEEHSILKWTNFLPPLTRFKIKGLQNVSSSFVDLLLKDIRQGHPNQTEKILVIQSKIIEFSFAIQESIQKIIEKKDLLLKNALQPYIDNACCNEKGDTQVTSLQYFIKENNEIAQNNLIVYQLSNVLSDIHFLTQSILFLSSVDTKRTYPALSTNFNEETIYSAFINYCKFNSYFPIPSNLIALCKDKPDYLNTTESLSEQISKLKRNGVHYTEQMMIRLLELVSRENIIKTNILTKNISPIQKMSNLMKKIDGDVKQDTIVKKMITLMENLIDTFDVTVTKDTEDMRSLKNYLDTSNKTMRLQFLDFIKKKAGLNKSQYASISNFINNLSIWEYDKSQRNTNIKISDDAMYNCIQYIKNSIVFISKVLPNMILNKQKQNIYPPKYWGLSVVHTKDVKQMIQSFYEPLKPFYDSEILHNVLTTIQTKCEYILELAQLTPTISDIKTNDIISYSIFDKRIVVMLYEYYFLLTLTLYTDLASSDAMINIVAANDEDVPITTEMEYMKGNLNQLKEETAKLLTAFIHILASTKETIDVSYETVMDKVFKLKEKEKDEFTDRLKKLSTDERNVDTILKINKLGVYNKGLLKGLKEYDPENYDQERELMNKIATIEKRIRQENENVDNDNMDIYMYDELENMESAAEIEEEVNDMGYMNDDYLDGDIGDEQEDQEYYD